MRKRLFFALMFICLISKTFQIKTNNYNEVSISFDTNKELKEFKERFSKEFLDGLSARFCIRVDDEFFFYLIIFFKEAKKFYQIKEFAKSLKDKKYNFTAMATNDFGLINNGNGIELVRLNKKLLNGN